MCVPAGFMKMNSSVDIFSRKRRNMEQLFDKQLFLQTTLHWKPLTIGCFFHTEKAECLWKRKFTMYQKDKRIYRGDLAKRINQKHDLISYFFFFCFFFSFVCFFFFSFFNFVLLIIRVDPKVSWVLKNVNNKIFKMFEGLW